MGKRKTVQRPLPPSYVELADALAAVVVRYVCGVDHPSSKPFIGYTGIGPEMERAIATREALIANGIIERKGRQ